MIGSAVLRVRERVAALAPPALAAARDERDLAGLLDAVWREIEEARALAPRAPDAPAPACRAGCAGCCRVNVGTLAIEGAVVAARLRTAPPPGGAEGLLAFHDRVRWLEDRERVAEKLRCPLLDDGARCTVHPVRPLACRGLTSLDAGDCARALTGEPPDEDGDEDAGLVRMDLLERALHDEALDALAGALTARGLDARRRDVSGMTAAFLADSGLAAAWLAGARVPLV